MISKNVMFYMNTIFIFLIPTAATTTLDDVHILATVLYGTDTRGRILLIAGPLPSTVEDIIKADQSRMNPKAIVKVVPMFKNITSLPPDVDRENILQELKSYSNVLKADLSNVESRKMLKNFWHYIVKERDSYHKDKKKAKTGGREEHTTEHVNTVENTTVWMNKSSHDDYMPNDIYYAIEKKCANWADGCDSKSPSILDMSSSYFKVPVGHRQKPFKLRWP